MLLREQTALITFILPLPQHSLMTPEEKGVAAVADLMALAARTAPKGKGVDTLEIVVLAKKDVKKLAARLDKLGDELDLGFFHRDAKNIAASDGCVIIGCRGREVAGISCGGCGYATCADYTKAAKKKPGAKTPFAGPNCVLRMADLGIAVGSAVKTAQIHNVDNRIMYSGGVAALSLGLFGKSCTVAYAIPLSATGKNIFFDRPSSH
ncbi:MAG: hypothetical protein A4E34_02720 [Methanoregula sp. PtaU1.Bin006]|nr:MAG: hypothetical protein A4E33_00493 [Methanoregula sp. PtaB.Bin085]OPY32345.1 MAG: hypothetical protein A4E34_02720 [Methanoregula sp. PtaU1.Bin006]